MAERMGFQGKLREVLSFAREREDHLLAEDVEKFFEEEALSPEQMELVFQYLTEQGIEVKGYAPSKGTAREAGEEETLALLEEFAGENGLLSSMTAELVPGEDREVDGLLCPTFRGMTPEGYDSGDLFAVAPDLGRVWQIEPADGQLLLYARPTQG